MPEREISQFADDLLDNTHETVAHTHGYEVRLVYVIYDRCNKSTLPGFYFTREAAETAVRRFAELNELNEFEVRS